MLYLRGAYYIGNSYFGVLGLYFLTQQSLLSVFFSIKLPLFFEK